MFIIQGTWVTEQTEGQRPYMFIWIEHYDETVQDTVVYSGDVIENFMYGFNAIIGERHQLTLNSSQLSCDAINTYLLSSSQSLQSAQAEQGIKGTEYHISGMAMPLENGSIADVMSFLVSLNDDKRWMQWGFKPGQSLRIWQQAAELTLQMLSSEHYIPSINADYMVAVWDGVLDEPRIEHRLNEMMMAVDDPYKERASLTVREFINTTLDGFIRESLSDDEVLNMMHRLDPSYVAPLTPTEHWLQGLFTTSTHQKDPTLGWIASDLASWRKEIVAEHNDMAFRTCFRLTAPRQSDNQHNSQQNLRAIDDKDHIIHNESELTSVDHITQSDHITSSVVRAQSDHDTSSNVEMRHGDHSNHSESNQSVQSSNSSQSSLTSTNAEPLWTLEVMLQATDDPSLLVPATHVWQEASETLHYLNYRFSQPQERLLTDLGQAQAMFPPIERLLKEKQPSILLLTTEEAYHFLSEGAARLSEEGFGVFVPTWWRSPAAQLGVKIKVIDRDLPSNTPHKPSLLGFNALIDYEWQLSLGEETLTLSELEQLAALKEPLIQHKGQWFEFHPHYKDEAARWLSNKGTMKLADLLQVALSFQDKHVHTMMPENMNPLLAEGDEALPFHLQGVHAEGLIERMIESLTDGQQSTILTQPPNLQGDLRPYQFKGFSWLVTMRELNLGTCLADDMGLGKTIQYIAYLLYIKRKQLLSGPALLVCPTSVLHNWESELRRFAPTLSYWLHHGQDRLDAQGFASKANEVDIIMTTYAMVRRDEACFAPIVWDHITLDEAQYIKNPAAKQTQSIRKLTAHHRIALTGTPIENRLSELWSIMDFLNPGYLGTQEQFQQQFETPIERHDEQHKAQLLQRIIQPFILRRLKSDRKVISDLPDKNEFTVPCTLTKEQVSLYEACIQSALSKVEKASGIERRGVILATITHLKQICNHPAHYLGEDSLTIHRSGKMMKLVEKLQEILARGERALIFTQYAKMSVLLQQCLSTYFKQEVFLIHGHIPKQRRDELIRRFQEDEDAPAIFVLSLKTGGFGLNLTRANHVIHYDRWWNPAVENQATDRAFRIGQERHVHVHKFICVGTLEERIEQMMISKQSLAANIVGKGEGRWMTEMSNEELRELMSLRHELFAEDVAEIHKA